MLGPTNFIQLKSSVAPRKFPLFECQEFTVDIFILMIVLSYVLCKYLLGWYIKLLSTTFHSTVLLT